MSRKSFLNLELLNGISHPKIDTFFVGSSHIPSHPILIFIPSHPIPHFQKSHPIPSHVSKILIPSHPKSFSIPSHPTSQKSHPIPSHCQTCCMWFLQVKSISWCGIIPYPIPSQIVFHPIPSHVSKISSHPIPRFKKSHPIPLHFPFHPIPPRISWDDPGIIPFNSSSLVRKVGVVESWVQNF